MKITKDMLRGWEACRDGYEWFLRRFPAGEGWASYVAPAVMPPTMTTHHDWHMAATED